MKKNNFSISLSLSKDEQYYSKKEINLIHSVTFNLHIWFLYMPYQQMLYSPAFLHSFKLV